MKPKFPSFLWRVVKLQPAWSASRSEAVDDGMPWHGIEEHRPLGELMRVRKELDQNEIDAPVKEPIGRMI